MTVDQVGSFAGTFSHHNCHLDDVQIHYVIGGRGDPLVLLHGWPQTWFEWRRVMPTLAEKYTVIAPDLRGLGDSSRPVTGYDLRTLSGDIRGLVRHLGLGSIRLVGHDLGGPVAYAYAAQWPGEVLALAVVGSWTYAGFLAEPAPAPAPTSSHRSAPAPHHHARSPAARSP